MQFFAPKHRAIGADFFVNETFRAIRFDRDRAADTDAETAGHRRFERKLRSHIILIGEVRNAMQHRIRAAGEDELGLIAVLAQVLFKRRGDKALFAVTAVNGRAENILDPDQVDEIFEAAQVATARAADEEARGNLFAPQFFSQHIQRRRSDAARNQQRFTMLNGAEIERIAERAEKINCIARAQGRQRLRATAQHLINEFDAQPSLIALAAIISHRPAQQRFTQAVRFEHGELSRQDGDRMIEPQPQAAVAARGG